MQAARTVKIRRAIVVRSKLEGFHHYPDAPDDVAFLRNRHRHLFEFELFFQVSHANRDLEFFIEAGKIRRWLIGKYGAPCEFGAMSCEHIAEKLLGEFFAAGCFQVGVYEDGENGAIVSLENAE